jgi:hypothetical protein
VETKVTYITSLPSIRSLLSLSGGALVDLHEVSEPFRKQDPDTPRWRKLTATRRADFRMHSIALGQFPGASGEDNPTCEASDYIGGERPLTPDFDGQLRWEHTLQLALFCDAFMATKYVCGVCCVIRP